MRKPTGKILEKLVAHQRWLDSGRTGKPPRFDGANFSGLDLRPYCLNYALFKGCTFTNAILGSVRHARFNGGTLRDTDFQNADLTKVVFNTNISEAIFRPEQFASAKVNDNTDLRWALCADPNPIPGWPAIGPISKVRTAGDT